MDLCISIVIPLQTKVVIIEISSYIVTQSKMICYNYACFYGFWDHVVIKKGEQIKSYLTQHPRITATSMSHSHTSMFKNYLSALGLSYSFINKVYQVLVCIHLITILIQKVMIQCVKTAVPRCVLNRLKVTRFKIQPTSTQ